MKRFLIYFITSLLLMACAVCKPVVGPGGSEVINVRDSIAIHYVDSTVIIPVERVVDIVPEYEVLRLETSLAQAEAWVDTTFHALRGEIKNKDKAEFKYIYKDKIIYKDSIQIKEVPVPYEVEKKVVVHPKYEKFLWICSVLFFLILSFYGYKLYKKIKPI